MAWPGAAPRSVVPSYRCAYRMLLGCAFVLGYILGHIL
jgi:hypothetical protein